MEVEALQARTAALEFALHGTAGQSAASGSSLFDRLEQLEKEVNEIEKKVPELAQCQQSLKDLHLAEHGEDVSFLHIEEKKEVILAAADELNCSADMLEILPKYSKVLEESSIEESLKQTQNVNNAKLTHHQTTEEVKRVNEQVMKLLESYQGLVDNINNQFDDLNNRVRRLERSLADQQ